ncbi:hypothetical protein GCM10010254_46880 [Streptomyces chromofuscus]|nr:hypothetical protein GCM10010254_46880 [Streptomyces chromofuscus]
MPAADASASTLATAPPWPTATGTFSIGAVRDSEGAAAPTDTTAADTAATVSFLTTGRRIRTSSPGPFAQPNRWACPRQERERGPLPTTRTRFPCARYHARP